MKLAVVAAAVLALTGATVGPAAAGTTDFFPCANPVRFQWAWSTVSDSYAVLEHCPNPWNNTEMYRGNVINPQNGDVLRIKYRGSPTWVEHSYRSAPHDVDKNGQMPGEWYYAGDGGWEIQACLAPFGNERYEICSQ